MDPAQFRLYKDGKAKSSPSRYGPDIGLRIYLNGLCRFEENLQKMI